MFEIRNHNGDTMFAVDEEGGVVYKGHGTGNHTNQSHLDSIALNDRSLYIGSTRMSFDARTASWSCTSSHACPPT